MRRHANVVNLDEVDSAERLNGKRFGGSHKGIGKESGSIGLGCNYFEVPPGRAWFPHHWHAANEESIFITEGTGTMRIGDEEVVVRSGDYISFPPGPDSAHQLINTSEEPLRYLCFSTKNSVEVVGYPDSKKIAALAGDPMGPSDERWAASWFPEDAAVGYFVGEDMGEES